MIHRLLRQSGAANAQQMTALTASPDYYALVRQLAGQSDSPVIRSLGITSSRSGEGVSTVALQCAAAAEHLFGEPVLLVEANMARPALQRMLKLQPGPGLSDLLLEAAERDDCVQRFDVNLSIVTGGKAAARQLGSCSSESIARTVDTLQEGHRLTIWDLSAVGADSLALEFACQLDGVLLVVEAERVLSDQAQQATERLRGAGVKLLGAVLNKQRQHVPGWLDARL